MNFDIINPSNGTKLRSYPTMSDGETADILAAAAEEQAAWRATPFAKRATLMHKAAQVLRDRGAEFAQLMTEEMGKPTAAGLAEVEKCAWACDYYADNAETQLADQAVATDAQKSFVCFEPLGVVLAVMPWNYPYWQVFRFAAPTLMAGNAGILKHSPNVTGCALSIESVFKQAGFPEALFRTIVISNEQCKAVIENPHVNAVSLTGSVRAGKTVAAEAGAVLKKCVLELGGSDAYLVLEDADLDVAAKSCVQGRFVNSGQSCVAAKRFIVVEPVFEAFKDKVIALVKALKMGDPTAEGTTIGPMARADLRDELHQQVQTSIDGGATCLLGGQVPDGAGCFYPPTVLVDVKPGMPAYSEEMFGPVASLIRAKDEADAVRIANDSEFGLGGAVFTRDTKRGERLASLAIHSGAVFVNQQLKSDPRLPFGGIKNSGYGRELGSFGIHEFVNAKSVSVA